MIRKTRKHTMIDHLNKILFILISLIFLNQNALANKIYGPEEFFKKLEIDRLSLSPTGKYLAARAMINGNRNVVIIDRKTMKTISVHHFGDREREVGNLGWLNDERIFASMVTKVGPLEQPAATGYLFAANADGSKKVQLLPQKTRAGKAAKTPTGYRRIDDLKNDPDHILISKSQRGSSRSSVYLVNVNTGRQKRVLRGPIERNSFGTDNNGVVRITQGMSEDYKTKTVLYRQDEKSEWRQIDHRNTEESTYRFIKFNRDNSKFYYYLSEQGKSSAIYLFDPISEKSELVHEVVDDYDIEGYIESADEKELLGVFREKGKMSKEYFSLNEKESYFYQELDKAFPRDFVRIIDITRDQTDYLLYVQSDRNPGNYYIFDSKKGSVDFLLRPRNNLATADMAERRPFEFKARDGLNIRGYLTIPNQQEKNNPLILLVHGGPYGVKDSWFFDVEAQFLANHGYAVMQVNYRGSGGRGLDFQYDNYRKVGKEMQHDLTDATHWAIEQGYADKERICIYGASYGGYASMMGVVMEPELYKCAIAYAGVNDIAIQASSSDTRFSENGRKFLEDAWNAYDDKFVKERSALYHLDKLRAALFLVHGKEDKRTPYKNYTVLADALDKMNYPYESLVKDFEGHGFRDVDNQQELYSKMLTFLENHIGK